MKLEFQVLGLADLDEVFALSEANLAIAIPDEVERRFQSWGVRWRREELEHYLKLGWSFIARDKDGHPDPADKGAARGYFLGQPLLYFRGQIQTLWVEHIEAEDAEVRNALIDVAVRVAREKHFQRVLFGLGETSENLEHAFARWPHAQMSERIIEIKTTKG